MGDVIICKLDEDSIPNQFAWTVTVEPSDGEGWESFACGPHEYYDAIALADAVALEDEAGASAVVAPVLPVLSAEEATATIGKLREVALADDDDDDDEGLEEYAAEFEPPSPEELREGVERMYQRVLALKAT